MLASCRFKQNLSALVDRELLLDKVVGVYRLQGRVLSFAGKGLFGRLLFGCIFEKSMAQSLRGSAVHVRRKCYSAISCSS